MTYDVLLRQLTRRGLFHIQPGLDRVSKVLAYFGNPQNRIRSIHIAGTNGKGSVAASLESILRHAGFHTGLYTSPHLSELPERIQIDRHPITRQDFAVTAQAVLLAERALSLKLTYFEFVTVMAFIRFAGEPVDIAIIETGLGGRWDATNVLTQPELSIITSIGRDHMQWLGKTVEAIAGEKAGIIKSKRPVISGAEGRAVQVIAKVAALKHAPCKTLGKTFRATPLLVDWERKTQTIRFKHANHRARTVVVHLLGTHQVPNAAVTLAAVDALRAIGWRISDPALRKGLQTVEWAGRLQIFKAPGQPTLLLDGAHNLPGLQQLLKTLAGSPWVNAPKTFLFSVYRDKEYGKMIELLAAEANQVVVSTLPGRRALNATQAAALFQKRLPKERIHRVADPLQALQQAMAITPREGLVVAAGSLAFIGTLLQHVNSQRGINAPVTHLPVLVD